MSSHRRLFLLCVACLAAMTVLAACASEPSPVAVSGTTTTTRQRVAVVPSAWGDPVHLITTTTTTQAPTTTTQTPTTTAPVVVAAAASEPVTYSGGLHPAIAAHFGTGNLGHQAQRVAQCESGLNPSARSRTNDHGLFQLHAGSPAFPGGWVATFEQVTGVPFFDGAYDAHLNARFARYLYDQSGWQPWACRGAAR